MENLTALLAFYQGAAYTSYQKKYEYSDLGYLNNNNNCIFGIQSSMAQVVKHSENKEQDAIDIYLGDSLWYLANYCQNNQLKLWEIVGKESYEEMMADTADYLFEDFMEMHRKEITLEADMSDDQKILFVKKQYLGIFPNLPFAYVSLVVNTNLSLLK